MTDTHRQESVNPTDVFHSQPEWWRVTLASVGDAVICTDNKGRVVFVNPVAESLTGWLVQEAVGQPLDSVFRIINEHSCQRVESPTLRALREGVVVGLGNHSLIISKDGTERPIEDSAAPIRNDKGEVAGVVLVFRDISERRRAEQELKKALAYADDIIATLREPFVVLDQSLRVRSANRSFYGSFQVTQAETENRRIHDLGDGQWNIPALRTLLDQVLSERDPIHDYKVEYDFPTIGQRTMLLNARQFPPEAINPELILLAISDITESKQAEAKLKQSEVRFRRLFETAKDGILILDVNTGQIIDANPFMSELLDYPHAHFLDKELWQIGVFGDKSANEAAVRELQQDGYVRYDHLPLQTREGQEVAVEFVSNVYGEDGEGWVAQCNIRDITERSHLEDQVKTHAVELSDLHRRKDDFLAMLSHELRNPLAPLANAVHLLRLKGADDGIQREATEIIERQVAQLSRLVDDLLEVSRITTGKLRLRQERVVVGGIVERAVQSAQPLIEKCQHELTISQSHEPIWLYADATRLEQVVVNLLTNAAKYSNEHGHIWLTIEQEADECVLRVRDTGVGIDPELMPRIFELFTQAERSLDRSQGGLGIGLALVHRLVEMHGGRVEVHSSLGQGSEFVVRLPVAGAEDAPQQSSPSEETVEPGGPSLRVLVVDDNVGAAKMLSMLVKAVGHDVRTAHDGPTGLQAALDYRPDVVLLDIGLPKMNGYEVAKHIRNEAVLENVVLVAMTGYGQDEDRKRSQEAGINHHLVKPGAFKDVQAILAAASEKAK
ncbi:MAG: PAS domain S-box protein [Planctomycetaceae bacterium]